MMRFRGIVFSGVAALLITLSMGACSSSSKSSSGNSSNSSSPPTSSSSGGSPSSSPTGSTNSAQGTGAPIKVGVICSCSGPFAGPLQDAENAYKAWANTVNGSGGINNHPLQLILKDDGQTPGTAITDVETLVADHVDAIADISNVDESWATEVKSANIPVVGVKPTNAPFESNSDFYPDGQTVSSSYHADLEITKATGATNIGLLYCTESPSCEELVPLFRTVGKTVGLSIAYTGAISATAPNYTAQCVALQQAHVQALFIGDAPTVAARVAQDCARQGYKPIYITSGEVFNNSMLTPPGLSDNDWVEYVTHPYWDTAPEVLAMNAALDKYYPGMRKDATNFTQLAAETWPAGLLLEDAVKAGNLGPSDTPSPAEVVHGLESLKGDTLDGWSPPLTFTADEPHQITCWFTAHVHNGVPSMANNGQTTCQTGSSS